MYLKTAGSLKFILWVGPLLELSMQRITWNSGLKSHPADNQSCAAPADRSIDKENNENCGKYSKGI